MNATPDMFPEVVPAEDPNRRYTTREFMAWIKTKAGVEAWDLDTAYAKPGSRKRVMCDAPECRTAYHRCRRRDERRQKSRVASATGVPVQIEESSHA